MSGPLHFVDVLSFNKMCPLVLNAIGDVAISISAAFSGSVNLNASLQITPPNLGLLLSTLATFDANCSVGLALGLPTVSFGIDAALEAVAKLELAFDLLIQLDLLLDLANVLWGVGVRGIGNSVGTQIIAECTPFWPDGLPAGTGLLFAAIDIPITLPPPLDPNIAAKQMMKFLNGIPFGDFPSAKSTKFHLSGMSKVTFDAMAQGNAAIQYQLDLALQLAAHFNITPPSFSATIAAMAKFQAYLVANADLALPKVKFALDASVAIMASIGAKFSAIINLGLALNQPYAEVYAYTFDPCSAVTLGTTLNLDIGPTALPHGNTWGNHGAHDASSLLPCHVAVVGGNPVDPRTLLALGGFFAGAYL